MSSPAANCPSCGAPLQFRWSSAVQTVCTFCHSILVRTDLDLKAVGQVADLPPSPSPICLFTEGVYRGKSFQVLGRILYEWEGGGWNEWHIVFSDGSSGWLSDAQLQYAVTFLANPPEKLPAANEVFRGHQYVFNGVTYEAATTTLAGYKGVEGELPFPFYGKSDMRFADLRTAGRDFGTLDYSEPTPVLFLGESVDFEDLHLKHLREFEGWPGGPIQGQPA